MTGRSGETLELQAQLLGALPIVDVFLARMRVDELLGRWLTDDPRVALPAAHAVGLLVRNLCVCREPIYALGEWAVPYDPGLLGLTGEEEVRSAQRRPRRPRAGAPVRCRPGVTVDAADARRDR